MLLRSKLNKKIGKQFYYCSFESDTGKCNKPVTEIGYRHHLMRIHCTSIASTQGRHSFMLTKNTPIRIPPHNTISKLDSQKQDLSTSSTSLNTTCDMPCLRSNNRIPRLSIAKELFRYPIQSPRPYIAVNIYNELDVSVSPREPLPTETRPSHYSRVY